MKVKKKLHLEEHTQCIHTAGMWVLSALDLNLLQRWSKSCVENLFFLFNLKVKVIFAEGLHILLIMHFENHKSQAISCNTLDLFLLKNTA